MEFGAPTPYLVWFLGTQFHNPMVEGFGGFGGLGLRDFEVLVFWSLGFRGLAFRGLGDEDAFKLGCGLRSLFHGGIRNF